MTDDKPKRSRLEDEVLEILAKTDRPSTATEKARSHLRVVKAKRNRVSLSQVSWLDQPWGWFGIALVVFLIGGAFFDSGLVWQLIRFGGLAAVIMGVVRLFKPARPNPVRKIWRGRPVDMSRRGPDLHDKWDDWRKRR
jgi:hypothetical protein